MKVAVTGANGHLGANLCRQLQEKGYEVRALIHRNNEAIQELNIEEIKGSITHYQDVANLVKGCETVFHLAAVISINSKDKNKIFPVNLGGTEHVLKACQKNYVKRLIYLSSIHTLQQHPLDKKLTEDRPLITKSTFTYEYAKAKAEKLLLENNGNLEIIVLNPTSIIGPFDFKPSLMGQFQLKLYTNQLPGLVKGGYNWVDVRDVANAAINAIQKGKNKNRYILAGQWTSLADFAKIMANQNGKAIKTNIIPDFLAKTGVPFISFCAMLKNEDPLYTFESLKILKTGNRFIDHSKAAKELGFSPRPLRKTIRDTYIWFKQNHYLK